MDQQLLDLYHRHVGAGFDRQLRLADLVDRKAGGEDWSYDVPTAALSFGPKLTFEAPVIGSHADHNGSWLWAWANRNLKLTLTNRALGDAVRALAHRASVPAFAATAFPAEPLLGELGTHAADVFGVILARELGYDAYFLTPTDGGRGVVLVRDDRLRAAERYPLWRVLNVFPQAIAALPIPEHKPALAEYARDYGLTVTTEGHGLRITGPGKGELTARFDDRGRLIALDGADVPTPKPPAPAKAKPKPKPAGKKAAKKSAVKAKTSARKAAPTKAVKKPTAAAKTTAKKAPAKKPAASAERPAKKATASAKKVVKPAKKAGARR
ncbi:MAG: hypothetical protein K2X82_06470 [Gemmataceae bacterium]|nr:hypothetical protein [Gemmataceae bacterium]